MTDGFTAQVGDWCQLAEARATSALKVAAQGLLDEAKARAGPGEEADDLRASMTAIDTSRAKLGVDLLLTFPAADNTKRLNYGFTVVDDFGRKHGQPGRNFIGLATQRWPRIVREAGASVQNQTVRK